MPLLPQQKQSQVLGQGGVSGFQDSGDARSMGQHLELLGKTVSAVADGLHNKYKEDTHLRTMWESLASAQAKQGSEEYLASLKAGDSNNDGSKFKAIYDEGAAKRKEAFLQTVPEAFRETVGMSFETSKLTNSGPILKRSAEYLEVHKTALLGSLLNTQSNSVLVDPKNYNIARITGIDSIVRATQNGALSQETLVDNIKGYEKTLAKSQISGLAAGIELKEDFVKYKEAKEAIKYHGEQGTLTPEESDQLYKSLEAAKNKGTERIVSRDRAVKAELKDMVKEDEQRQIEEVRVKYASAKTQPQRDQAQKEMLELAVKVRYEKGDALKSVGVYVEGRSRAMSMEIAERLGNNPSNAQIDKLRNVVSFQVADNKLTPEEGKFWLLHLDNIKDKTKKDPLYAIKMAAIHAYIKNATHSSPFSLDKSPNTMAADHLWFTATQLMSKGMSPENALEVISNQANLMNTTSADYTGRGGTPSTPVMGVESAKVLDDMESVNSEIIWLNENRASIGDASYKKSMEIAWGRQRKLQKKKEMNDKDYNRLYSTDNMINGLPEGTPDTINNGSR